MKYGYIKLYRHIQDNELWLEDKFTRAMAWIDLLMLANHEPRAVRIRGIKITIGRGQTAFSIENLSKRWQRNRKTVMRWLKEFEDAEMVDTKRDNLTTLISIRNYDRYQDEEDTKADTKRDTIKNVKKKNKEYVLGGNGRFVPPKPSEIKLYCIERNNGVDHDKFHNFYESKGWMVGKNKMKCWKSAVRGWEKNNPKTTNNFLEF